MKRLLILLFFIPNLLIQAQTPRETRAVWVSTNFRLDWPSPTFDEEKQKEELKNIFDVIESKNLNTIYFQVRSNGTVLFRSSMELFSPYITGNIGEFGSYDPLEFAIEEAHKRGLEIHAWVNTIRVFSGSNISIKNNPLHISTIHPKWVYEKSDNSIWLNPGIPEVRDYLVELLNEIVQNYNIDGIQLDFIRYPKSPISDTENYNTYGGDILRPQWRRDNITNLITLLNKRIKQTNPKIKLGVTPIGIYKSIPNGRGMQGYSDVFQDTREWLKLGIIDYAVPQIYWDVKSNPKFDVLSKDWVNNSFGKNIIIGIGAYKTEVFNEIEREINVTRNLNASGVAFFRYKNIAQKRFYSFNEKTLPAEMTWIEERPILAELKLTSIFRDNKASINFEIDNQSLSNNGYFALYESDTFETNSKSKLLKVLPNYISEMSFSLSQPNRINYYYSATQFDQLWNESSKESNIEKITIQELSNLETDISLSNNPIIIEEKENSLIIIFSNMNDTLLIFNQENSTKVILKYSLKQGINRIELLLNDVQLSKIKLNLVAQNKWIKL